MVAQESVHTLPAVASWSKQSMDDSGEQVTKTSAQLLGTLLVSVVAVSALTEGGLGTTAHSGLLRIFGTMSEVSPKAPEWEAGTWKAYGRETGDKLLIVSRAEPWAVVPVLCP